MDLAITFAGVTFKNPLVVSAGSPTINPYTIRRCLEAGAGGISTKSISDQENTWFFPWPANYFADRYEDPGAIATIELAFWPPDVAERYLHEIRPLADRMNARIIANIACEVVDERLHDIARRMEAAGADLIECAGACPILMSAEEIAEWHRTQLIDAVRLIKEGVSIPVVFKTVSMHLPSPAIQALQDVGLSAVHDLPDVSGIAIDIETATPIMPSPSPYFGRGMRAAGCHTVSQAYRRIPLPLMSTGAIRTPRDAIERMMCGATLVGVCTAVIYQGYGVITEIVEGMEQFLERKGYARSEDIVGLAVPRIDDRRAFARFLEERRVPQEAVVTQVDASRCTGCERCTVCLYDAMAISEGIATVNLECCQRCGVCMTICPVDAIRIVPAAQL